jgi:hypothetical protein
LPQRTQRSAAEKMALTKTALPSHAHNEMRAKTNPSPAESAIYAEKINSDVLALPAQQKPTTRSHDPFENINSYRVRNSSKLPGSNDTSAGHTSAVFESIGAFLR